jgi:hypothetical protein
METEHLSHKDVEIVINKLARIESHVAETKVEIHKLRKLMFWRLIIILAAVLISALAIPFFLRNFIQSYLSGFQNLL